jgi:TolA-binding protein
MFVCFSLSVPLLVPSYAKATTAPSGSANNKVSISRIVSIATEDGKYGTKVNVLGNGSVLNFDTNTLECPPRIIVDIFCIPDPAESKIIQVKSQNLKSIRVGYHPKKIRLVLDIDGADMPTFQASPSDTGLMLFLRSKTVIDRNQAQLSSTRKEKQVNKGFPALAELMEVEKNTGQDDVELFIRSVNSYKSQKWAVTIGTLEGIIKTYPNSRYAEKTYFLLARAFEEMHSYDISKYFTEIKDHYEDAVNRFPESIYVPSAMLAIGNLCFKTENHSMALGYYNLIIKKYEDRDASVHARALSNKIKIQSLKKDKNQTLSTIEYLILKYPGSPEETEAKLEMAKILYEQNNFRKSLNILTELTITDPENIYHYPEISLYLGYNYYQFGENLDARENLYRFYSSCPEKEVNHLVLAKIGDTYLDEGLIKDAVKLYQLVLEEFPDKEGALISLIRLAEQQEKGSIEIRRGVASPIKIVGKEIGVPREIYEEIMKNILEKEKESPLVQLAFLKLAVLYHKEENYDRSFELLKDFRKKYPKTSLNKEWKYALSQTVREILKGKMKMRKYRGIVNFFLREKELFSVIDYSDPFLLIARACLHLNINDMATEMFQKANYLLSDNEKPADLLYHLGYYFLKNGKPDAASRLLTLLTNRYPSDKYAPRAYQAQGEIFLDKKDYIQATEAFSRALSYDLRRCDRARILKDKAKALAGRNQNKKAFDTIQEADDLKKNCHTHDNNIYREIGDIYLNLGRPKEALSVFFKVLESKSENEDKARLNLKIAECYRVLGRKEDYLALCSQVSGSDDPFWSEYAKERAEEINFGAEMEALKKQEGR